MDTTQTTPVEEPQESKFIDPADAPQFFIDSDEDEDEEEAEPEDDESEDEED